MKLIHRLTWKNMKASRVRTLVTVLGILLSAAMFTAVTTLVVSFQTYFMEVEIGENGDYFVRYDYGTEEDLENLRKEKTVTQLGTLKTLGYTDFLIQDGGYTLERTAIVGAGNPELFRMLALKLEQGRLPETGSELVLTEETRRYWEKSGKPCEIGQQITLPISVSYDTDKFQLPTSGVPFEKTFTIVGIVKDKQCLSDCNLQANTLLTFDDGSQPGIWNRFFVKTAPWNAYALAEHFYGIVRSVNEGLLNLYGVTKYISESDILVGLGGILVLIIMVGSVSLIYNAFSISVSERTRQFGLLSSVGATRKQIRKCVFTEAIYLSAVGIPLGILTGYSGIAVTLHLTHSMIDDIIIGAAENNVTIRAVPSWPAFAAAGAVALITVLISAWIPARRAAKVTPIAAVRQTGEYRVPRKKIRVGKLSQKLFGFPAGLARKYYTVNRRKYRATVISLTVSMVLFVAAGSFIQQLNATVQENSNTNNFDFEIQVNSEEEISRLREHPAVKQSALVSTGFAKAVLPENAFTEGYRKAWEAAAKFYHTEESIGSKRVKIQYLEDSVLEDFLKSQGIRPTPYLNPENPLALAIPAQLTVYEKGETDRYTDRHRDTEDILKKSVQSVSLIPDICPNGVIERLGGSVSVESFALSQGTVVQNLTVQKTGENETLENICYQVEIRPGEEENSFEYYLRDPETGKPEERPADVIRMKRSQLRMGAAVRELPFGIGKNCDLNALTVVLPLSAADSRQIRELMVSVSDYKDFRDFLLREKYEFTDCLKFQMRQRDYIQAVRIFSYGFIVLISLICICNVFHTISTNIALRQRDFGMLRSVGMKNREIRKMLAYECLQYGLNAILWGVPLSLFFSVTIYRIAAVGKYAFPVSSLLIASGCIFLTVFITMLYGVGKLKNQNPMEAIRTEQ